MKSLSQKARLVILAAYAVFLLVVCKLLFGTWLPPNPEKGLWFYAAFAHLLLGTLLLSPFFTKPVDAVSDAVIAALVLSEVFEPVRTLKDPSAVRWLYALFGYYFVVIVFGSLAMLLRGARSSRGKLAARSFFVVSTELGETSLVFSLLYFFALIAFHLDDFLEFIVLVGTWAIIVPLRPLERVVTNPSSCNN